MISGRSLALGATAELLGDWQAMLGHQLPVLPPFLRVVARRKMTDDHYPQKITLENKQSLHYSGF